jgi:hypothetical protein
MQSGHIFSAVSNSVNAVCSFSMQLINYAICGRYCKISMHILKTAPQDIQSG